MGYMGLPIASLLAEAGYQVTGVDLDSDKVAAINQAQCPFDEAGLPELISKVVAQGFLVASTDLASSETYLVAVPTPHKNSSCDRSYVFSAVDAIIKVAKDDQTVIIESTISPQTSLAVVQRFADAGLNLDVVHCPERAIPGQTLHELVNNDRIIGATNLLAQQKVKTIYQSFVKGEVFLTDLTTAECIKLVENTSRDVGIAFANELAQICKELDVDVYEVIRLANRHPRVNVLTPGPGVGGHCIPIDPWFLVENTKAGEFVRLARSINDQRPRIVAQQTLDLLAEGSVNLAGKKIGMLGVAYKANVDDCRESPADAIFKHFIQAGVVVNYHDPFVPNWHCERQQSIQELDQWADILILVTDHECYNNLTVISPLLNTRA
jgi:UDP-N-acetylglucosamine 2-epimerase (non-hydrolysing)